MATQGSFKGDKLEVRPRLAIDAVRACIVHHLPFTKLLLATFAFVEAGLSPFKS